MFGISFSELLLVGLVALLVLGPERLPGAARTAGLWIGRLKRSFNSIKMEVEREIGADDIRRHTEHRVEYEVLHHRHPSHAIADYANDASVSLVVATTHGRTGPSRVALGSEAMGIVHRSPRPVLLSRPPAFAIA